MSCIDSVEVVEKWVLADLSASIFSDEERSRVLDDIDTLEEQLVTWDRALTEATTVLTGTGNETVYRRRTGDLRSYFIREADTLYCIGVGKRKTTYDRDFDQILTRANDHRDSNDDEPGS